MSTDRHPQLAQALEYGQQLQSALEDELYRTHTETFTATDETKTVEVTVNGRRNVTDLRIEDGLLRLGAETVERRVNEALRNAAAVVKVANEAQQQRLVESLAGIAGSMTDTLGLT
ncbi:ESX-1 secretion-associated protein EspL [Mycobacterium ahvazicum]|uniref:ESX-1 secretion-associated protein EspL n=1 Tax=Mycobacterium ahvazicum TaxID=1964395 RepID=A0A2K4Y935_9MYCO|nr:YbaB/EbfC family nucleoid-associated protein [Mycobacterium ahvazicum]SOX53274.1 ESX-1 secretion-associated protein EspL [Mycobacterium ahvazicum]